MCPVLNTQTRYLLPRLLLIITFASLLSCGLKTRPTPIISDSTITNIQDIKFFYVGDELRYQTTLDQKFDGQMKLIISGAYFDQECKTCDPKSAILEDKILVNTVNAAGGLTHSNNKKFIYLEAYTENEDGESSEIKTVLFPSPKDVPSQPKLSLIQRGKSYWLKWEIENRNAYLFSQDGLKRLGEAQQIMIYRDKTDVPLFITSLKENEVLLTGDGKYWGRVRDEKGNQSELSDPILVPNDIQNDSE